MAWSMDPGMTVLYDSIRDTASDCVLMSYVEAV